MNDKLEEHISSEFDKIFDDEFIESYLQLIKFIEKLLMCKSMDWQDKLYLQKALSLHALDLTERERLFKTAHVVPATVFVTSHVIYKLTPKYMQVYLDIWDYGIPLYKIISECNQKIDNKISEAIKTEILSHTGILKIEYLIEDERLSYIEDNPDFLKSI